MPRARGSRIPIESHCHGSSSIRTRYCRYGKPKPVDGAKKELEEVTEVLLDQLDELSVALSESQELEESDESEPGASSAKR